MKIFFRLNIFGESPINYTPLKISTLVDIKSPLAQDGLD
jgi:hypothetical protein